MFCMVGLMFCLVLINGFVVQRLLALKRAYADIILNTAKEAAARIMVSERKAVGFQYELSVAKEQALQTLLRLKQMMDSKVVLTIVFLCLKWVLVLFLLSSSVDFLLLMLCVCFCYCNVVGFCGLSLWLSAVWWNKHKRGCARAIV